MALDKRTREELLAHCGELHEDGGVAPRGFFKAGRVADKNDRKARQLCRQVADTLDQILGGEIGDHVLQSLHVANIEPAPDSSRLLVTLHVQSASAEFDPLVAEERLARFRGRLRCEVAAAITRRKAPTLVFQIVGPGGAERVCKTEVKS
jgi:ribosome-binding factor A